MDSRETLVDDALALAAQADLVLISVEMLRPPNGAGRAKTPPWHESTPEFYTGLLATALGGLVVAAEAKGPTPLHGVLLEVLQLARQLDLESWINEYSRLFEGSQACSLNQASYIRRDKGAILGDVCGFYAAFGWRGIGHRGERPDHLLCQLEFVGMLLAMAAQSKTNEHRCIVEDALAKFARLHMHDWLPSACQHLIETSTLAYFGAVAQWLMLLWKQLTEYHDWPGDPVGDYLLPLAAEPDDPYECGSPDVVQLGGPSKFA